MSKYETFLLSTCKYCWTICCLRYEKHRKEIMHKYRCKSNKTHDWNNTTVKALPAISILHSMNAELIGLPSSTAEIQEGNKLKYLVYYTVLQFLRMIDVK